MANRPSINELLNQAKTTFKAFEDMENGPLAKARHFVQMATQEERKKMTNARILNSLKAMGVATTEEVTELRARVEELEAQVAKLQKAAKKAKAAAAAEASNTEASGNA